MIIPNGDGHISQPVFKAFLIDNNNMYRHSCLVAELTPNRAFKYLANRGISATIATPVMVVHYPRFSCLMNPQHN